MTTQVQGMGDLITAIKGGTAQLTQLNASLKAVFPQIGGTVSSATAGGATLPAKPVGFLTVVLPNGTTAEIPYYAP